ncbi:MAG: type II secretion system major pseudopilin GspG [Rhodospirillales bacterium]|nr:type II secretion system major pseudopilin GspG [Rhodospirillales bacterium]
MSATKAATRVWPTRLCRRRLQGRGGFTLVELLVVLAILSLIATVVTTQVIGHLGEAEVKAARLQVEKLSGVLDLYRIETGDYPPESYGLEALLERPPEAERWSGPYVKKADELKDPWGRRFEYRYPGEHGTFDLYSLGKDGQEGGEDTNRDILSWE